MRTSSAEPAEPMASATTRNAPTCCVCSTSDGARSDRAFASNAAIFFSAAFRLAESSAIRAGSCSRGVLSDVDSCETSARSAASCRKASCPTRASTRRFEAPTEASPTRLINPTSALADTWVPPQSSRDQGPPMSTMRTVSPYFSPKSAIAPSSFASSSGSTRVVTSRLSRTALFAISSISDLVASDSCCAHVKSNRI